MLFSSPRLFWNTLSKAPFLYGILLFSPIYAQQTALLENGESLLGKITSWDEQTSSFTFRTNWSGEDIFLPYNSLATLTFQEAPTLGQDEELPSTGQHSIELSNGDSIHGNIIEITPEQILIETNWGTEIALKANFIQQIYRLGESEALFSYNPSTKNQLWQSNNVHYEKERILVTNSNSSNAFLNADLDLPSSYKLKMEFDAPFSEVNFSSQLHVDANGSYQWDVSPYSFHISSGNLNIEARVEQLISGEAQDPEKTCLEIYVDRNHGIFAISVNNGPITSIETMPKILDLFQAIEENKSLEKLNTHLQQTLKNRASSSARFDFYDSNPIAITTLEVHRWNAPSSGIFSGIRSANSEATSTIELVNGDYLSGKIMSIQNGLVEISTSGITIPVLLENILSIQGFQLEGSTNQARRKQHDVKIQLYSNEVLTLSILDIAGENLIAESDHFATPVAIPLALCKQIEFDLYSSLLPSNQSTEENLLLPLLLNSNQPNTSSSSASQILGLPTLLP